MSRRTHLGIPNALLTAAKAVGLSTPDWYVGSREDPAPRGKSLEVIVAETQAQIDAGRCQWCDGEGTEDDGTGDSFCPGGRRPCSRCKGAQ